MHLVWLREHNRVAAELQTLNPSWNDEELYQEAKKITTAELVHVTYNEWLPLILGTKYMSKYRLFPQRYGYSDDYDPTINPSVTNEFSTAAFRFGHTLLQSPY
jgi:peroxidase